MSTYADMLKCLMGELNRCDIYCMQHPQQWRFTWRNRGRGGWVQSRLDMFLVSEDLNYNNIKSNIYPSIKSDHSLIHICFSNIKEWTRGRGFYKFNTKLLQDTDLVEKMNMKLSSLYEESKNFTNKAFFWEFAKCEIRGFSVTYSSYKSKQTKQKEKFLQAQFNQLEKKISETPMPQILNNYNDIKTDLEDLYIEIAKGSLVRVRYINENEKGTKYFFREAKL